MPKTQDVGYCYKAMMVYIYIKRSFLMATSILDGARLRPQHPFRFSLFVFWADGTSTNFFVGLLYIVANAFCLWSIIEPICSNF